MIKAYLLIETAVDLTPSVKKELSQLKVVKTVNMITGPFDIIAYLEAEEAEIISSAILETIRPIQGIKRTLTCVVMD